MSKVRVLPHHEATEESCSFGPWKVIVEGVAQELNADSLRWDYTTELQAISGTTIDREELVASTGIHDLSDVAIVAIADCAATGRRFKDVSWLTESDTVVSELHLPAGTLAKSVTLQRSLVLMRDRTPDGFSAHRAGSRLLEQRREALALEGTGSRFPTEAVSFKKLGYGNAPWRFELAFVDPGEESFMGSARLLINADHPVADALTQSTHPQFKALSKVLLADILRTSVLKFIAGRNEIPSDAAPDSVAAVIGKMSETYMRLTLPESVELIEQRPEEFEVRLKDKVEYLKELA